VTAHSQLAAALDRISSITSIVRTRSEDGVRTEVNGGSNGTLTHRVEDAVQRLESVVAKLEATV
jgi:hypothetical protein